MVCTGATTTPSGARRAIHDALVSARNSGSSAASSASRFSRRAAMVAKRASAIHSGRPASLQKRRQNSSCEMKTTSQPSAVSKTCAGTM